MTADVIGRVPRVALVAVVLGLGTATLTLAASSTAPTAPPAVVAPAAPQELVVPDVRRQAYVFAKGSLEQDGFAWRVVGDVPGYAANTVVAQTPAPGARVVADGNPIVVLRLERNGAYSQEGVPDNAAPYPGKPARLVGSKPVTKVTRTVAAQSAPKKAAPAPKAKPAVKAKPAAKAPAQRPPAFTPAGAPAEPLDEITLSARARRLAAWVEAHPRKTRENVNHWLYQHNWIVTGARFGWSSGAQALRTLIAVDRRVQKLWEIGARSEIVARRALTDVEKRSR
ncbi:MAG TPA: PASTA domain-containing protein [Gaiellaceae bacterium]|nr:PASTA domain-containing protein [Gaiellaceae bacterium]